MTIYVDMFLYLEMKIHENPATYFDVKSKVWYAGFDPYLIDKFAP
jgi:hypothetical protein